MNNDRLWGQIGRGEKSQEKGEGRREKGEGAEEGKDTAEEEEEGRGRRRRGVRVGGGEGERRVVRCKGNDDDGRRSGVGMTWVDAGGLINRRISEEGAGG